MIKKIFGLLTAIIFAAQAYASVSIAPTKVEINANKARNNYLTTAIDIKGDAQKPTRLRVSAGYFVINSNGEADLIDEYTGDPHDISKKIKFIPSEFNILPKKSQKLRVNIIGLNQLPDGESRAILYIEDVDSKEYDIPSGKAGFGAQLIIKTRVGVPLYVDKGNFTRIGEIESVDVTRNRRNLLRTEMKVKSTGNSRLKYTAKAQIIKDKKLISEYNMNEHTVGESNSYLARDLIDISKVEEAGDYTLRIILTYKDEKGKKKNLTHEVPFTIEEEDIIKDTNTNEEVL